MIFYNFLSVGDTIQARLQLEYKYKLDHEVKESHADFIDMCQVAFWYQL